VANKQGDDILEQSSSHSVLPVALRVEPVAAKGSPAKAFPDACHDADLIVIGRAGRGLLRERVVASVATQISHHAKIPAVFVNSNEG
jgi:nucleotide-binding universal stress UspA family protein